MTIPRWDTVDTGPLGERMIAFLEHYPKADEIYITSAMDGDHGPAGQSHHYGLWYKGSRTAAIDIGAGGVTPEGSARMRDLARWLYDNFSDYTVELIHTTPFDDDNGFYVKNQVRNPGAYDAGTKAAHLNHVHWATSADLMTSLEQLASGPLEPQAIPDAATVWGWDASDWDWTENRGPMDLAAARRDGISFFTHKTTEGSDWPAVNYQTALERARAAGIPVLGGYHFLWPGNIEGQIDFWIDYVESHTPWWKDVPWIWQIDAEGSVQTPPPSAAEVAHAVAALHDRLNQQGRLGYVIAYAPRSKYGNNLPAGFDIWNADYRGSGDPRPFRDQYQGVTDGAAGWAPMSGRKPRILQFAEDGHVGPQIRCDVNKFDGTLHDLVRLCGRDPDVVAVPPVRDALRTRIAVPSVVPGLRSLEPVSTEGFAMALTVSEQSELLALLRDLAPRTRRLEELLARAGGTVADGGGGAAPGGVRSLDAAAPAAAGYWDLNYRGGYGATRSIDPAPPSEPSVHRLRGTYISGRRTPAATAKDLPRTRGLDAPAEGLRVLDAINPGPPVDRAVKIGDVTGPQLTDRFSMAATDLGVMTRTPSGRIIAIFGDTFRDAWVGSPDWRATVGLISDTKNLDEGIVWTEAAGRNRNYAAQLWDYPHLPCPGGASTVLPSDIMTIGNTMYLHTSAHFPFGNVTFAEIWKSTDEGRTWVWASPRLDTNLHGGLAQLWTWDVGDDGFVYIMSTGFRRERNQPIILRRVPVDRIGDPGAYQGWGFGPGGWGWGNEPTPVLDGGYGELCLRRIDGQWVLVAFNARDYRLDVRVFSDITSNLYDAITFSPIVGGDWGMERDDSVAQLYGPSIIPGSRPGSGFHIFLSQWRVPPDNSWPYHVMQFKIPMPSVGGPRDLGPAGPRDVGPAGPPAKKVPATKAPAKKVPAKKVPAKKAPVKKAAPAKAPAKKAGGR